MNTIQCPSDALPGPVPVSVEIPEEWTASPAPMVSFVAVAPEPVSGVTTNAVVVSQRVWESIEIEQIGEMIAADLGEIEGAVLSEEDLLDLNGLPGLFRVTEISLPEGGAAMKVMQVAALSKCGGGVADVVTLTITLGAAAPEEHVELCRQIAGTLRVGDAAGAGDVRSEERSAR